jgi:hypothetical protein
VEYPLQRTLVPATRPRRQNLRLESLLWRSGCVAPDEAACSCLDGSEVREVMARPKPVTSEDASTTAGPVDALPEHGCGAFERVAFLSTELRIDHPCRAARADNRRQRQCDVLEAQRTVLDARYRQRAGCSPRMRARSSAAVTRPMACLVAPLRWMISYAALRTWPAISVSSATLQVGQWRSGTPTA